MELVQHDARSMVYRTKVLGSKPGDPPGATIAFPRHSQTSAPSSAAIDFETRAVSAVDNLDEGLYAMNDAIAARQLKPEQAKAIRADMETKVRTLLGNARTVIRQDREKTAARRTVLLAPPAVQANDLAQVMRDFEIRSHVRGLPEQQRQKLFAAIDRPTLEALARDPTPHPTGQEARAIYAGFMKTEQKDALAQCDCEDEGADILQVTLDACEALLK